MCGDLFSPLWTLKRRGGLSWVGSGRSLYDPNQNEVKRKLKRSAIVAEERKKGVGLGRVVHYATRPKAFPFFHSSASIALPFNWLPGEGYNLFSNSMAIKTCSFSGWFKMWFKILTIQQSPNNQNAFAVFRNESICMLFHSVFIDVAIKNKKNLKITKKKNLKWLNRLRVKPTFLVEKISGIFPGESYVPWNFPEKFNNVCKVICKIDKLNNKVNIEQLTNRPLMINS